MAIGEQTRWFVRRRAGFACEYCGINEIDAGGELCIDHFHSQSQEGSDDPENLVYCCVRCNLHKGSVWRPNQPTRQLWNPRQSSFSEHFELLVTGELNAVTTCGEYTLELLSLNRPQLVQRRLEKLEAEEITSCHLELLASLTELIRNKKGLRAHQINLLKEHRKLLARSLNMEEE
jgi:HNH endonuclease